MERPHKTDSLLCLGYQQGQIYRTEEDGQEIRSAPSRNAQSQAFDHGFDSTTPLFLRETDIYETQ